jgi:hypothetical protein
MLSQMYIGVRGSTVYSRHILSELNCLIRFSKHLQVSNFIKIDRVEAELFHAERRTDGHDKANNGFRNSAKVSKKGNISKSTSQEENSSLPACYKVTAVSGEVVTCVLQLAEKELQTLDVRAAINSPAI